MFAWNTRFQRSPKRMNIWGNEQGQICIRGKQIKKIKKCKQRQGSVVRGITTYETDI